MEEDENPSDEPVLVVQTITTARPSTSSPRPELSPGPEEFIEDEPPSSSTAVREGKPKHIDETRRTLAVGMLWLVAVVAVLPTIGLILSHWTHFGTEAYREVALVFTPVVALTSAAFGFFFASDDRNRP
ncbi:hypothetical protein OHA02_52325 [Streptomyces phaeochromogenes]|nr:hypothetical protein [Streptomyces phaeochromogenes]